MTKFISIDAFGGYKGPKVVLGGINQFLYQYGEGQIHFRIFGKKAVLSKLLAKFPRVKRNCTVVDAPDVIQGTDKVRDVIRHADGTSMFMAIKDVRLGNSSAVVSAGNTGVLMSLSKLALKTIDGISRPAITTMLPSGGGDSRVVVLDLGANVQCDAQNLFDFAILGSVYADVIGHMPRPRVGILNIGTEETKGNETLQQLNHVLKCFLHMWNNVIRHMASRRFQNPNERVQALRHFSAILVPYYLHRKLQQPQSTGQCHYWISYCPVC